MEFDTREFAGIEFRHATPIDAERDFDGAINLQYPYKRFDPTRQLPLVPYGEGPHIKLKLQRLPDGPGAYVVVNGAEKVLYVGIATISLRQRWGGVNYGAISPRNCFKGGQSTNVRINFLIGQALTNGEALNLWVRETPHPKPIELQVFAALKPPWTLRV